ncbi:MAG TPA: OmpA family protein [Cytophagaceae bacterium]|jgi:peptidoglycan-associated lipoprotein|nr:OmpA family protein [Cytophagaceae bacterium]
MNKLIYASVLALAFMVFSCAPKATKYMNKGKQDFEEAEYQFAIENFQTALSKGGPSNDCNYYIAESYRRSNRIHESEQYYKKAIDGGTTEEDAYFYHAMAMKSNGNYEGATNQFKNYINIGTNFDLINKAKAELANLKVINDIISKKSYYKVYNIDKLNTEDAEYSPYYYNDKLYFTSSRGADKMHAATNTGFTDLYEYIFDGTDKFSGQAKRLPEEINTADAHEASCVFTDNGKTIIFSRGNNGSKKGAKDVQIYTSKIGADGKWTEAVPIEAINDVNAWNSCPALSKDGKTLYFSSNRENGSGGADIYKSELQPDGNWGTPVNLGAPINTKGSEWFPYVSPEGVFYFSSDGHPTLGAMDLFRVKTGADGKAVVENLGTPTNTSYDDFAIFYKDSTIGFFTSNRPGGKGDDDIYEFLDESKIKFAHYILDLTSVYKSDSSETVLDNTTVKIVNEKGDTLETIATDAAGKYKKELDPGTYKLVASKNGFLTDVKDVTLSKVSNDQLKAGDNDIVTAVKVELRKKEITVGPGEFLVRNIYYDYDKADIRPDAALELNKLVEFLKLNPDIRIELGSHTDERGSDKYNMALSQRRAQSAVNYIISKGIAKNRITAKGYGESKLKIKNAQTEEEHQTNRRTTFRITGIDEKKMKVNNPDEEK